MIDTTSKLAEALEGLPVEIRDNMILIEENGFHDAQKEGFSLHGRSCPDEIISALTSAGFEVCRLSKPERITQKYRTGFCILNDGSRHEFLVEDGENEEWDFYERGLLLNLKEPLSADATQLVASTIESCFAER